MERGGRPWKESGVGEIELAVGNGKISIGDGFSEEKAIGDTSLPSRKYVSKLQVEIACGEVIEHELAFAVAALFSVALEGRNGGVDSVDRSDRILKIRHELAVIPEVLRESRGGCRLLDVSVVEVR